MAIATLAYKLVMDASPFKEGAVASRKELNLVKRLMAESKSEAEQLDDAMKGLESLFRKGAFGEGAAGAANYERALQHLRKEFSRTTEQVEHNGSAIDNWIGKIAGGVALIG